MRLAVMAPFNAMLILRDSKTLVHGRHCSSVTTIAQPESATAAKAIPTDSFEQHIL
jgi:hypothetical protein